MSKSFTIAFRFALLSIGILIAQSCSDSKEPIIQIKPHNSIVLIGNNLGSRMMNYGSLETELHLRYPKDSLFIRNMSDAGDTPGFRPHSGRVSPWAFPGAEKFQTELAQNSGSEGEFETSDEWLTRLNADIILAFFGYNESFEGAEGLENYKEELDAFIKHSVKQKYNGTSTPQLVLISPIAFEDLSDHIDVPNGISENQNLKLYTDAMSEVAAATYLLLMFIIRRKNGLKIPMKTTP